MTSCPDSLAKDPLHSILYRGHGPIPIFKDKDSGGWFFDDDLPGNVCHHIMSLRWLSEVNDKQTIKSILQSFVDYHADTCSDKSKYYLGSSADHTASIRVAVMLAVYNDHGIEDVFSGSLYSEITKTIDSCLFVTYKKNNNHGLMVDKALLECISENHVLYDDYKNSLEFIATRLKDQLDSIFDNDGYCKEHSVAYQEYNLGIVMGLIHPLEKLSSRGLGDSLSDVSNKVSKVVEASRKSLGWLLKNDGEYIPIGDSYGAPKKDILKMAYGSERPIEALQPYSTKHGVFYNKTLGVSVYRNEGIHIAMNASWHSYVHKQNDDLNIFFRSNGEDVFIDGGYSSIIESGELDTKSEHLHSTVIPKGKKWINRNAPKNGWSIIHGAREMHGRPSEYVLFGEHSRAEGNEVTRKVFIDSLRSKFTISDNLTPSGPCIHRFIIPKFFSISIRDGAVSLNSSRNRIGMSAEKMGFHKSNDAWSLSEIKVVKGDEVIVAHALDYLSDGFAKFTIDHG